MSQTDHSSAPDLQALIEENRLLREVLDIDLACICVKDMEGRFVFINKMDAALYQKEPAEMVGRTVEPYVGRSQFLEWLEEDNAVIRSGRPVHLDPYVRQDVSGKKLWFDTHKIPLRNASGIFDRLLVIHRDITSFKDSEMRRQHLEMQLLHSQKMEAVGTLAAGVAHNFNNLLTIILGLVEQIKPAVSADSAASDNLHAVERAALQAAEVTRGLLSFSRRSVSGEEVFDLREVLREACRLVRTGLPSGVALEMRPPPEPCPVKGPRFSVSQTMVNLLINARDALPEGGVITVSLSARPEGGHRLIVADNGYGMDEATQKRIFEPFFTTKEVGRGTGLGLSFAYNTMVNLGGTISVSSRAGHGTEFTLDFPPAP